MISGYTLVKLMSWDDISIWNDYLEKFKVGLTTCIVKKIKNNNSSNNGTQKHILSGPSNAHRSWIICSL